MKKITVSFLFLILFAVSPFSQKLFALSPYFSLGYTVPLRVNTQKIAIFDSSRVGYQFAIENQAEEFEFACSFTVDYQKDFSDEKNINGLLFGSFLSFGLSDFFEPYVGAGLGILTAGDDKALTWKVNTGFRVPMNIFCIRFDLSCSNVLGFAGTVCAGMRF